MDGAKYYEINSTKEGSIRFWKSLGFVENGKDEYDMLLLVKRWNILFQEAIGKYEANNR